MGAGAMYADTYKMINTPMGRLMLPIFEHHSAVFFERSWKWYEENYEFLPLYETSVSKMCLKFCKCEMLYNTYSSENLRNYFLVYMFFHIMLLRVWPM